MSQPCGFLADMLSCSNRHTYQTLIAPPYTCPICNGGFADRETIEMVQGPWGCNQMLRNHVGGSYAVPGQWGNALPMSNIRGAIGPAITPGALVHAAAPPMYGFQSDHRLTGPYGGVGVGPGAHIVNHPQMMCNDIGAFGHDCFDERGWSYEHSGGKNRHKSKYKYRYSDKAGTNCVVM